MEAPFTIALAGINIRLEPRFPELRALCAGYLTDGASELTISVSEADILYERQRSAREDEALSRPVRLYSDGYLETLAIYRKLAVALLPYSIILMHGSCVAVDGQCYLFTAKSGTGKSTHTRLWREAFGSRAVMVNDDKPLLKLTPRGIFAYGTPWDGKHRLSTNVGLPLKAICILERSAENQIAPVSVREVYPLLLQQTYRPREPLALQATLTLLDGILSRAQLYRLGCNMDPQAAVVSYRGMNSEVSP